jgi:hypothetical protein
MRIHTQSFGRLSGSGNEYALPSNPEALCWPPATEWLYELEPQTSAAPQRASPLSMLQVLATFVDMASGYILRSSEFRASEEPRNTSWKSTLIGSNHTTHSALKLCAEPNSWGSDFVSFKEGMFCDMTSRTTWPLCSTTVTYRCYDWKLHALVDGRLHKREMKYEEIKVWG